MKKEIYLVFLFASTILLISCAANEESQTETTSTESLTTLDNTEEAEQENVGETTWQEFKAVIRSKDEEQLKNHCTAKITDYQGLFFMLNELYVMQKMDETEFDELESVEVDGMAYLQFYAEEIGEDEFGYEYASAITLHFILTDKGLFLDHYSAAG